MSQEELFETPCQAVEDIIMRSLDPDLFEITPAEKALAEAHLKACKACRDFHRLILEQQIKAGLAKQFQAAREAELKKQGILIFPTDRVGRI